MQLETHHNRTAIALVWGKQKRFMHQAVRVGHTDHTGSIVSLMACIFDLKKKVLCNRKLIKIVHYRRAIALIW